ncbi:hypothetical protein BDP81DRAFT_22954 [Colletotrichum phormii]|uniref:Uncharacterized protein n=1 Tax=Colletotrichum phormii TaxID=359342 RepID=A0AAJ0EEX6_9PEZI|nr:uncharacterized protein BDP81DRAFT_22954 [Colletotrichum phormii]KAK1636459.1 hypothetical protein BDP81DRAFT_22954 [Colletotrichum phormii]
MMPPRSLPLCATLGGRFLGAACDTLDVSDEASPCPSIPTDPNTARLGNRCPLHDGVLVSLLIFEVKVSSLLFSPLFSRAIRGASAREDGSPQTREIRNRWARTKDIEPSDSGRGSLIQPQNIFFVLFKNNTAGF